MIVKSKLTLERRELRKRDAGRLLRKLTFVDGSQNVVQVFRLTPDKVILPRGAWSEIPDYIRYKDKRSYPALPELKFALTLDDTEKDERFAGQSEAVAAMFEHEQGLIIRPPGTGKTQIALNFIATCRTRTLVIVHTHDILKQWVDYARNAIPGVSIGIVRGQTVEVGHLTIGTIQTLRKLVGSMPDKWWQQFGCVILDEAHHGPARSFEIVLNHCPAKYRFGFTASPTRADGMEPALRWLIGPVIHKVKFTSPVDLTVVPIKTNFRFRYRGHWDWGRLLRALIVDERRNNQIAKVVNREVSRGNSILVLSRRIEHLKQISERLECENEILNAARGKEKRNDILGRFRKGEIRCVLATQLADEALDIPRLNRVCLVHPGKHEGRIIQQIGRALREFPGKKDAIVYDFVDHRVRVLMKQWLKRKHTYKKLGIKIRSKKNRLFGKAA